MDQQQYILPFEAPRNELLALLRMLRDTDLGLSPGRSEGVVQILERLTLLGTDLTERDGRVVVKAQMSAIGARITGRATKSERTVRNWRRDAETLGMLVVNNTSQKYGGSAWNEFAIDCGVIRTWTNPHASAASNPPPPQTRQTAPKPSPANASCVGGGSQPEGGGNGRKGAEIIATPRAEIIATPRAEIIAAPTHCLTKVKHSPPQQTEAAAACAFLKLGVAKARPLVSQAIKRGCTPRQLLAITRWYQRSQARHPGRWDKPATVLMIRLEGAYPDLPACSAWIRGNSRPQTITPAVTMDDAEFQRRRAENRRSAATEPSMGDQLAALRRKKREAEQSTESEGNA